MKGFLEEYGGILAAVLLVLLLLLFLLEGLKPGGFLEELGRAFETMTIGY